MSAERTVGGAVTEKIESVDAEAVGGNRFWRKYIYPKGRHSIAACQVNMLSQDLIFPVLCSVLITNLLLESLPKNVSFQYV